MDLYSSILVYNYQTKQTGVGPRIDFQQNGMVDMEWLKGPISRMHRWAKKSQHVMITDVMTMHKFLRNLKLCKPSCATFVRKYLSWHAMVPQTHTLVPSLWPSNTENLLKMQCFVCPMHCQSCLCVVCILIDCLMYVWGSGLSIYDGWHVLWQCMLAPDCPSLQKYQYMYLYLCPSSIWNMTVFHYLWTVKSI